MSCLDVDRLSKMDQKNAVGKLKGEVKASKVDKSSAVGKKPQTVDKKVKRHIVVSLFV